MMSTIPHCYGVWRKAALILCMIAISSVVVAKSPATDSEALTAPIASRNLSPLYANLGIPVMASAGPVKDGEWMLDWTLHWASHSVRETGPGERLELDGETQRQDFRIQRGMGHGFSLSLNVPYISHSGGELDGLIDGWHQFWGMPDGPRAGQSDDRLRFAYYKGSRVFDVRSDRSGIGDLELAANWQVSSGEFGALSVFTQYKFDTGARDEFTGSGDSGASLGARWSRRQCVFADLHCHLQLGVSKVGNSAFDGNAETLIPFLGFSLAWRVRPSMSIVAQIDSHEVVYDAAVLRENGAPLWGTLGIRWQAARGWLVEGQFVEDLAVGSAPDVSFRFSLSHAF